MPAVEPVHDLRGLLRIAPFRKLWTALGLSSLGDWLGLFATVAMASVLSKGGYAGQNFAIAGVFLLRLVPAVLFGPIAGVVADRLDRRWTMVACDVGRALLFVSIPVVGTLWWLFVATFLIEILALFWIPAKEATVPNLVPRDRLEAANQLSLVTTYGTAPIAAGLFTILSLIAGLLASRLSIFENSEVELALYFNAATFLFSALTIARLHIPAVRTPVAEEPSALRTLVDGWKFVGTTPVVRGVVIGMLGAFAAGGAVIGLSNTFARDLGAGDAAFGILVGTFFLGLAIGMFAGPRLLSGFSRRRLFGLTILAAGIVLAVLSLMGNIVIVVLLTAVLGVLAGMAWVIGQTLVGLEVSDELRGRTFAFLQSLVRIALVAVTGLAPLVSGTIGLHRFEVTPNVAATYNGAAITLFFAGLGAAASGLVAYRQMDDRKGMPIIGDLLAAVRAEARRPHPAGRDGTGSGYPRPSGGLFIALEGGEGAGKSTQAQLLGDWLRGHGHEVVVTYEPGATAIGRQLRRVLLDASTGPISPRAEALLYAADRAEHVRTIVRPALRRGAIVISDRYVDSSIAYQGAGRALPVEEVTRLSRWATDDLVPDLTVVLDLPPEIGLHRVGDARLDRLESETAEFHERVRRAYLDLAAAEPARYAVVDATAQPTQVAAAVQEQVRMFLGRTPGAGDQWPAARQRMAVETAGAPGSGRQNFSRRQGRSSRRQRSGGQRSTDQRGRSGGQDRQGGATDVTADPASTMPLPRVRMEQPGRGRRGRHAKRAAVARDRAADASTPTEPGRQLPIAPPESAQAPTLVDDLFGPRPGR